MNDAHINNSKESVTTVERTQATTPHKGSFTETIRFTIIALVIVIPFRLFIAQPFIVEGASMNPTFKDNQYLIVDQISYKIHLPQRGDIVVFRFPRDPSKYFIKRIIGLPGETVTIDNNEISITPFGKTSSFKLPEPYLPDKFISQEYKITTLNDDEYFVMGDNRPASSDSRAWGALPKKNIIGTPIVRLYPFSAISYKPGN